MGMDITLEARAAAAATSAERLARALASLDPLSPTAAMYLARLVHACATVEDYARPLLPNGELPAPYVDLQTSSSRNP